MTTDYGWHRKVMDALEDAVELTSPGALTCALADEGQALAIAPSLLEMQDEEGHVFPHFSIDVSASIDGASPPSARHRLLLSRQRTLPGGESWAGPMPR